MKYNKKTAIIILICIFALQIIFRLYIGYKKEYFHMDEAYSYGLMNYDKLSIVDNEDFFNDSLEYFNESNFKLVDINRNYINENEPMTAYQARFVSMGKPIFYAKYSL